MPASFDPKGIATPVEGGYSFSGRFGFASGIDHADWLICGGFIVDRDKGDGPHFCLLRRSEATIIDDWHTIGLEGTGSKSFSVEDVFVPDYALLRGEDARTGNGPGAAVNPGGVYRLPRGFLTPALFASMTVGMAQGLLDQWLAYTATRMSRGTKVADNPTSHVIVGECAAEIDAAEALNRDTITAAMKVLEAGGTLSDAELLRAPSEIQPGPAVPRLKPARACSIPLAGPQYSKAGRWSGNTATRWPVRRTTSSIGKSARWTAERRCCGTLRKRRKPGN